MVLITRLKFRVQPSIIRELADIGLLPLRVIHSANLRGERVLLRKKDKL
jgi:hypothetical protein